MRMSNFYFVKIGFEFYIERNEKEHIFSKKSS